MGSSGRRSRELQDASIDLSVVASRVDVSAQRLCLPKMPRRSAKSTVRSFFRDQHRTSSAASVPRKKSGGYAERRSGLATSLVTRLDRASSPHSLGDGVVSLDYARSLHSEQLNGSAADSYYPAEYTLGSTADGSSTFDEIPPGDVVDPKADRYIPAYDVDYQYTYTTPSRTTRSVRLHDASQPDDDALEEMLLEAFERIVPSTAEREDGVELPAGGLDDSSASSRACPYSHLITLATPDAVTSRPQLAL